MGAWNYGKSECLLTLGYYDIDYSPTEEEIEEEMAMNDVDKKTAEQLCYECHQDCVSQDFRNVKALFEQKKWLYYDIKVEPGYYEGFWISISDKFYELNSIAEKKEWQEELNELAKVLNTCVRDYLMRVCYPGWCIGWEDTIESSIVKLSDAINKERKRINKFKVYKP